VDVLILQIQTGCEGINLQDKYSEVYFVSPSWNPAVEDQAIARCHRIGQKKNVCVFKFGSAITTSLWKKGVGASLDFTSDVPSLDYYIDTVQNNKREIRKDVLSIEE
jgi:hypothetical protein